MKNIIIEICKELNESSKNHENIKDYSRFHKDNRKHISLATPIVRKLSAKKFSQVKHLNKKQIFKLCEKLLKCDDGSYRDIAFDWAFRSKKQYTKEDFVIFEEWLDKYVDTWGSCDDLCTHAFGYFLFIFPEFIPKIHEWTKSKNRWKRRASAVIFIYSARKGKYLEDILKIARSLSQDEDDLVQKAYGWMLKEASNGKQKEIFDFVIKNRRSMSRTALRYSIEKMSVNLKKQAMQKD
jgi:3-methyladenine DNA glycosylase AlkD